MGLGPLPLAEHAHRLVALFDPAPYAVLVLGIVAAAALMGRLRIGLLAAGAMLGAAAHEPGAQGRCSPSSATSRRGTAWARRRGRAGTRRA